MATLNKDLISMELKKKQLTSVFDFDYFEINQNVRNAKEITDYVNKLLGTKRLPINVKGYVKEILKSRMVFKKEWKDGHYS